MKPKKLIEVSLPIKEISAESVRDKSIRHGHISTLHLWWARRPLPVCRAIVFASLVPDPLDPNCPQAFRDGVKYLLQTADSFTEIQYRPYADIPYTSIIDPMEDNLRNRLMMFIGKFSDKCQKNMIAGTSTTPKEQLSDGSLIKWENKNNPKILRIARELIWVAYNADLRPEQGFETLHENFNEAFDAIGVAENELYSRANRHIPSAEIEVLEGALKSAIENFQVNMPSVFDPFAGGGAIPLEAARLGCRSYGNDINPVAHIIERASAEFPQQFGKPITYSRSGFEAKYGKEGLKLAQEKGITIDDIVQIPNRLAFDVEYFARQLFSEVKKNCYSYYFPFNNKIPAITYWMRFCRCENCRREIPLFKQYYFSKPRANKLSSRIKHFQLDATSEEAKICVADGITAQKPTVNRGNVECPFCGSITDVTKLKKQFLAGKVIEKAIGLVFDDGSSKVFSSVDDTYTSEFYKILSGKDVSVPQELMQPNSAGGDVLGWGFTKWGELFNLRQLIVLQSFCNSLNSLFPDTIKNNEYEIAIKTYLAILIDRIAVRMTSFGKWHILQDTVEHLFGRQAIQMNFDYPELNPFSQISSCAEKQLESILAYIESENITPFTSWFSNCASGEIDTFKGKAITATVTDPPYYDAIAYADISDFFYVWLKRCLSGDYPIPFATPQTPKKEECTALKHHHNDSAEQANIHFENKLSLIFSAIERQTSDIVSIMFAHQSTKAWTTLCNSILTSNMNITGSWPMDTEVQGALKTDKAFLESSVTVACRPSERKGYGDYKEVKTDIKNKVTAEVESLYELGFRGSDLLTACFGQAVCEFGKYEMVEKADGSTVTVAELLELARSSAFDALLKGIKADDYTRFYIGWLQMNGMGDCDSDDATKFTRVGVNVEINEIKYQRLLIADGNHVRLATAEEHLGSSRLIKDIALQSIINQVHRAILLYREGEKTALLSLIKECAPQSSDQFWRVLATLKELLPAGPDLKDVTGLLLTQDTLRVDCQKDFTPQMPSLFDEL